MKTYTPVRGMIECVDDSGTYVSRADFEEESARLGLLQNRLGVVQVDYQHVGAKLKSARKEVEVLLGKMTDLGIQHAECMRRLAIYQGLAALGFALMSGTAIALAMYLLTH